MLKKILLLLLPAILTAGCIRDDAADCAGGFRLEFRYTHNAQGQNLLAERVRDIRIYVFDRSTGVLAHIVQPDARDITNGYVDADIPDGTYAVTAWGGGNDLTQGYSVPAVVGQTTLDDFRITLACDPVSGGATGEVTPHTVDFGDLFFADGGNIEVQRGARQRVGLDFIKNTSVLKIRITGLDHLSSYTPAGRGFSRAPGAGQPLEVFVTACNGVYSYNNRIDPIAPQIRYEPPYRTLTATAMEVDIKVQRLEIASAEAVLLYVRNTTSGMDMILPLNVVEVIMRAKDAQGNPLYRTQEDIDREDEFPIELSILHDLSVTVTVNGFEIVDTTPNVERP